MDFEKYAWGMHEFVLTRNCCKPCLDITLKVSAALFFILFPFFVYGNFAYVGRSPCLEPILSREYILDPRLELNDTNIVNVIKPQDIVDVYIRNPGLDASDPIDESQNYAHIEFSGSDYIVSLNETTKKAHNFTYHTIVIDSTCYGRTYLQRYLLDFFLGFDGILISELFSSMKGYNVTIKNMQELGLRSFKISQETIRGIEDFAKSDFKIVLVFFNLIQILFGLFLIFTITALHLRIFYIYFPVWFFLGTERHSRLQREAIRQYSWIGLYYHTLQNNGRSAFWIFMSQYLCYLLFGRLVNAVEVYWNFMLFDKYVSRVISAEFCGVIYWAELLSILFVRTQTSLKYIPRFTVLLLTIYVYYFQHTVYSFYGLALWVLGFAFCFLFTYFIDTFEKPALSLDQTLPYVPSSTRPRMLFLPVFSTTWIHDIPPIWTMFYPLFGRSHFTNRELAFVNNDNALLRQILSEASERGGFEQGFEPGPGPVQQDNSPVQIEIPPMNQEEINQEISEQNLIGNVEENSGLQQEQ